MEWISCGIMVVLALLGLIAWIEATCIHRNDFFRPSAIVCVILSMSDMISDISFAAEVWYIVSKRKTSLEYMIIFLSSCVFIIVPVIISLFQLHTASSKHWLNDNKIRVWLLSNSKYLYILSVFTGSSFSAIEIFNSNLFGFNMFDMGLTRRDLMSWNTKKLYSVIIFENIPQLFICGAFLMLGHINLVPIASMIFSLISIITTTMAMIVSKKIYFTQDYVNVQMDITGQCIMDNLKVCKHRIVGIKSYLCESVFAVQEKAIDIQKPTNIPKGLRMTIHILRIHATSDIDPVDHYQNLLNAAYLDGSLVKTLKDIWNLSEDVYINNVQCDFIKSKQKKKVSYENKLQSNNTGYNKKTQLKISDEQIAMNIVGS